MQPCQKLTGEPTDCPPAEKSAGGLGREYGDCTVSTQCSDELTLISQVLYSAYIYNIKTYLHTINRLSVHQHIFLFVRGNGKKKHSSPWL